MPQTEMDLAAHFAAMWRHRWTVLLAALLVAGATYGAFSFEPNVYQANAQVNVVAGQAANGQQSVQELTPFLAQTYETLAKTRPVVSAAVRASHLNISEGTASSRISVQNPGSLGFLVLTADGPSPDSALALDKGLTQALVNAVQVQQQQALQTQLSPIENEANQLASQIAALPSDSSRLPALQNQYNDIEQSIVSAKLQPLNGLDVVSPAQAGSSPVSPKPKEDALLAFVTGLLVFAELSVGYEVLADRFVGAAKDDEIRRLTGLPVLARIPKADGAGPEVVEGFRTLRTSLLFMNGSRKYQTIAVVSSAPQVGKSFIAINLAFSFADLGVYSALVDGDMRRPAVAGRLDMADAPGLSETLKGDDVVENLVAKTTENGNVVFVLPAGGPVADPAALLTGSLSDWVFPAFASLEAVVVVDTPAESFFPDASIIASRCDATVIVIDALSTRRQSLKALADRLRQLGANPLGVVVNRSDEPSGVSRYYSRTSYYRRSAEAQAQVAGR